MEYNDRAIEAAGDYDYDYFPKEATRCTNTHESQCGGYRGLPAEPVSMSHSCMHMGMAISHAIMPSAGAAI